LENNNIVDENINKEKTIRGGTTSSIFSGALLIGDGKYLACDSCRPLLPDFSYKLLVLRFFTTLTHVSLSSAVISPFNTLPRIILLIPIILLRTVSWIVISRLMVSGLVVPTIMGSIIPVISWLIPLLSHKWNQLAILDELLD